MLKRIVSKSRILLRMLVGFFIIVFLASPLGSAQAAYPGARLFTYQCNSSGIVFYLLGNAVLNASFAQMSQALSLATSTQQNQPILVGDPASLWALKSNELQVHLTADPENTKLVLSASICGQPLAVTPTFSGQALAYVQLLGPGVAVAFAQVTASGGTLAFAQVSGQGQALAYAQSTVGAGQNIYVVQPGDDLYRIALRFNTTVDVLVSLNGLSNADLIYAGQTLRIPG